MKAEERVKSISTLLVSSTWVIPPLSRKATDRARSQIGSVEGIMVPDHETYAYSASKAGLHHLSRTMGGRLGWEGITSNTIACGQFSASFPAPAPPFDQYAGPLLNSLVV